MSLLEDGSAAASHPNQFLELLQDQSIEIDSIYRSINLIFSLPEEQRQGPILENRTKHLYMAWNNCTVRHFQLYRISSEEQRKARSYFSKRYYEHLEAKYLETTDKISQWMTEYNLTQSPPSYQQGRSGPPPASDSNIKLPRINIPTFSGKFTDWATFKDSFTSIVKNRTSLSNLEKLHYLKSSVQGDANELICNVPLVESNFTTAWNLLETRYSNTRAIVNAHLNEIFSLEPIKKESAHLLLTLRNIVKRNLTALENLGRPIESYSDVLINRIVVNLDANTQRDWELNLSSNTDCPTFDEFDDFLLARIRALEALNHIEAAHKSNQNKSQSQASNLSRKTKSLTANSYIVTSQKSQCPVCDQGHKIYKCQPFENLSASERYNKIKSLKLCLNCLASNHRVQDCPSAHTCRECKQKHHTMLHRDNNSSSMTQSKTETEKATTSNNDQSKSENVQTHFSLTNTFKSNTVLLATVQLLVTSKSNKKIQIRALLDQGSTWSFISNQLAMALNAPRTRVSATLSGLSGTSAGTASSAVEITLMPLHTETPVFQTQALVLPKITSYIPEKRIALEKWSHLSNLPLADNPSSNETIHMLIGADLYGALILDEIKKGKVNEPVAQKTVFGWVISGPILVDNSQNNPFISVHHCSPIEHLNSSITKFWENEEIPSKKVVSPDDEFCESHFVSTHSRLSDGRYMVRIPFKESPPQIGQSRFIAERSLKRIESRLAKNSLHNNLYTQFMTEYETLNHMSHTTIHNESQNPIVYLPHHPIFRENSQTTKLRVVFNASSKTANGTSLNDHMHIGAKLQSDLLMIISQWRSYTHVLLADVAKMYRQILIDPQDRDYQRILWRSSPESDINEYQLNTVTYGTRSAPYLALRVLQQLVEDEGCNFPAASLVLQHDTFVDDLVFGEHDESAALLVRNEVIELLRKAQLEPRKWATNYPQLVSDIDPTNHGISWNLNSNKENDLKVLGIAWNANTDTFHFSNNLTIPETLTQRLALSLLSKLFDPIGWISPVVIIGKILMQQTWLLKHAELHGFADASQVAYGAVIYLRTINQWEKIQVSLITSRTKVAPLKGTTIPRLELLAALLLARLISYVKGIRAFKDLPVTCWTDSKVVLAWLSNHPSKWKLFVSNRVAEVQTLLPTQRWNYVPTQSNPADLASRGVTPDILQSSTLWWNGPEWLTKPSTQWPHQTPDFSNEFLECKVVAHHVNPSGIIDLTNRLSKYFSWQKTVRITAYVLKFIRNLKESAIQKRVPKKRENLLPHPLTADDLTLATKTLYKLLQQQMFSSELNDLHHKRSISRKSKLYPLNPFLDENDLIRLGGRLSKSNLPFDSKHPVILAKHPLVKALITDIHLKCLHGGSKLTLSTLRQMVWLINPRPQIKSVLFSCFPCIKIRADLTSQIMADLSQSRAIEQKRAFVQCGIDYAGPPQVRMAGGRGNKSQKCYIALFISLTVKAVHLELVSDLTSDAFIASYKRFSSRRGIPTHVYSDQGLNFKGANQILNNDFKLALLDTKVKNVLATDNVTWHFIPPAAPHFGGLWEAGVKSVKSHLKRILLDKTPTYEELTTLLCQIEAVLNSRPIGAYTDSVDDLNLLTPGHFLIGGPINAVPQPSLLNLNVNGLSRWQENQQMFQSFWKCWSDDYLQSLQHRTKWQIEKSPLKVNQTVLLRKPNLPPTKWNLARVIQCFPGSDNIVRVVKVKTSESEYVRPITELVLLPFDLDNKN